MGTSPSSNNMEVPYHVTMGKSHIMPQWRNLLPCHNGDLPSHATIGNPPYYVTYILHATCGRTKNKVGILNLQITLPN